MVNNKCYIIFRGYSGSDPIDHEGCLKPSGHFDHHVFRDENGKLQAWDYDDECECGCWDTVEEDNEQCMVFWEVKSML